jgi:hypothetical protein
MPKFMSCNVIVGSRSHEPVQTRKLLVNLNYISVIEPDPDNLEKFTVLRLADTSGRKDLYLDTPFEDVEKQRSLGSIAGAHETD